MPYLIKEKSLFFHISKTGGTTIMNYFAERSDSETNLKLYHPVGNLEWSHATYEMCKKELNNIFNDLYKFTIVRNPYDRIVSEFFYRKKYGYKNTFNSINMNFEKFVNQLYEIFPLIKRMSHINQSHFILQKDYCGEGVDIFKYEQFDEIVNFLNKKFNINIKNIKQNQSDHSNFRKYYNQKTAKQILEMYKEDFEFLGYSKNYFCEKFI